MASERWRKPRALRRGDRVAIVAPASSCGREAVFKGARELERWGLEVVVDDRVFATRHISPATRRFAPRTSPRHGPIPTSRVWFARGAGMVVSRFCRCSTARASTSPPKVFVGNSDITSLLTWLGQAGRMVTFHGPMLEGRLGGGDGRYNRESFAQALMSTDPMGALPARRRRNPAGGRSVWHPRRR